MLTVLVSNIKGGVGKTTISTHLAAAFATSGHHTILAEMDKQKSALGWLKRRPGTAAPIVGEDWTKELGEVPAKPGRLVIDVPAAMRPKEVEELVRIADLVVLPLLPGAFDEAATARFLKKLDELKSIRKNKVPVAVVGNRLRPRTKAADRLDLFLSDIGHQVATRLRDSQLYPDLASEGLSLFDIKTKRVADAKADWGPLLAFIENVGRG
ncbi:AAA family ATPase [Niveispirillum sp. SYP-B3756]|uniref:ParA family protein n=1 Tax=Niveispirillum sp. SYP-B3756 TaxID=2662178 RepID=UPI0012929FCC|nr:ParA family protein [Niveispirillum sp. SYP-B3756]MQP66124.1 AAA family ATPase [Niveispirillum sp. SYP-B3756]